MVTLVCALTLKKMTISNFKLGQVEKATPNMATLGARNEKAVFDCPQHSHQWVYFVFCSCKLFTYGHTINSERMKSISLSVIELQPFENGKNAFGHI